MKLERQYKWRVQWAGKWTTTNHHATEEDIRVLHPEAICLPETLIERQVPDTEEEMRDRMLRTSTGVLTNPGQMQPMAKIADFPNIRPDDVPF